LPLLFKNRSVPSLLLNLQVGPRYLAIILLQMSKRGVS
jgi:hypothetical protein